MPTRPTLVCPVPDLQYARSDVTVTQGIRPYALCQQARRCSRYERETCDLGVFYNLIISSTYLDYMYPDTGYMLNVRRCAGPRPVAGSVLSAGAVLRRCACGHAGECGWRSVRAATAPPSSGSGCGCRGR